MEIIRKTRIAMLGMLFLAMVMFGGFWHPGPAAADMINDSGGGVTTLDGKIAKVVIEGVACQLKFIKDPTFGGGDSGWAEIFVEGISQGFIAYSYNDATGTVMLGTLNFAYTVENTLVRADGEDPLTLLLE